MEKHVRKVIRVGRRSLSINIPADIVDELKIRERQKLVLTRRGKKIIVEDWKPKKINPQKSQKRVRREKK